MNCTLGTIVLGGWWRGHDSEVTGRRGGGDGLIQTGGPRASCQRLRTAIVEAQGSSMATPFHSHRQAALSDSSPFQAGSGHSFFSDFVCGVWTWRLKTWILPLCSLEILSKSLHTSEPRCPHFKIRITWDRREDLYSLERGDFQYTGRPGHASCVIYSDPAVTLHPSSLQMALSNIPCTEKTSKRMLEESWSKTISGMHWITFPTYFENVLYADSSFRSLVSRHTVKQRAHSAAAGQGPLHTAGSVS